MREDSGAPAAKALDRFPLGVEEPIKVVEADDLENVVDGLVEVRETDVAAARADFFHQPHDDPQAGARDVREPRAVDDDFHLARLERAAELLLELPNRVRIDEPARTNHDDFVRLTAFDRQIRQNASPPRETL